MNNKDRMDWAPPVLGCGLIFVLVFGFSMLLGIIEPSFIWLGIDFLVGCFLGYGMWLLFS